MASRSMSDRIVDVLAVCSDDSSLWPEDLRADCSFIHARFEALKLDVGTNRAWRQAKAEWVRGTLRESGMARIVYHFRNRSRLSS